MIKLIQSLQFDTNEAMLFVKVIDEGIGLKPEEISQLFKPFSKFAKADPR